MAVYKRAFPRASDIDKEELQKQLQYAEFPLSMNNVWEMLGISSFTMITLIYMDAEIRKKSVSAYRTGVKRRGRYDWAFDRRTFEELIETYLKAKSGEISFELYDKCCKKYIADKKARSEQREQKNSVDNEKYNELRARETAQYHARMRSINRIMGRQQEAPGTKRYLPIMAESELRQKMKYLKRYVTLREAAEILKWQTHQVRYWYVHWCEANNIEPRRIEPLSTDIYYVVTVDELVNTMNHYWDTVMQEEA